MGSGLLCLGRVVLRVAGATLSWEAGGPEGRLRPVAGEAGDTAPRMQWGQAEAQGKHFRKYI